ITRKSSVRARRWSGTVQSTKEATAASKEPSSKARALPCPSSTVTDTAASAAAPRGAREQAATVLASAALFRELGQARVHAREERVVNLISHGATNGGGSSWQTTIHASPRSLIIAWPRCRPLER